MPPESATTPALRLDVVKPEDWRPSDRQLSSVARLLIEAAARKLAEAGKSTEPSK